MDIRQFRQFHRALAPIVLFPLTVTVFTGVIYRLGKSWFGLSRDQLHFLMVIHEGEYFGATLEPIYVLLNGLGLLWMLATGSFMLWQTFSKSNWFRRFASSVQSQPNQNTD